jgi:hypothetical protein
MKGKNNLLIVTSSLLICASSALFAQPVIQSVYPPVLTQRTGEHAAYLVTATGTGTLTYQWYFGGAPLAGQTRSALVLTNIQTTDSGIYGVAVVDDTAQSASNWVTLNVLGVYTPLFSSNIVVARVGDGAQALSHATGNTVFLDQYTPAGAYVNTVMVPDESPGAPYGAASSTSIGAAPALLVDGAGTDSPYSALLTLSGNQQHLGFVGYVARYPFTNAANDITSSGGNGNNRWRGLGTVNAFGIYSLAYTNTGLYSGGNHTIRSMVSSDGVINFWTTGQAGSPGVKYVNKTNAVYALGGGIPSITSGNASTRVVQIVGTNLVFSDWAGAGGAGLYACAGIPTPAANAANTPTALILAEAGHPVDFAASPDLMTVYIADDQAFVGSTVQAGGVQRWDTTTPGSGYTYSYTLPANAGTAGARGVTVDFSANVIWGPATIGAVVYITSADATGNTLSRVVDNGSGSTPSVLVTAGANELLRGVRFGPSAAPVAIVNQPQSQTNFPANNATFTVTASGSAPYFYQWQFNGANISGATSSSLTLTNLQFSNAGNYTVVVSNPVPSAVTSSVAVLTVTLGKPTVTTGVQSFVETAGDHLALVPKFAGSLPISYQWYFNNLSSPIANATNSSLLLTNVQITSSGTYFVVATNTFGSVTNSGMLTITAGLQPLSSNNVVVARIGDGLQPLSGATGNTLYLDQYTPSGSYVNTIMVPDEGTGLPYGTGSNASTNMPFGSPALIFAGAGNDAGMSALLTLSGDSQTLNFAGYCLAYPFAGPDVTGEPTGGGNGGNTWRGMAGVDAYGFYSMGYTNTGLHSGGNHTIRTTVTLDGTNFWVTGQAGANGLKYANSTVASYANGSGIPVVTSSAAGSRVVQIVNGSLVFSDISGTSNGLYICDGLPTPGPSGSAAASLLLTEAGTPVDFAFSPDGQTVYISDNGTFGGTNVQAGGIQRWDTNVFSGGYTYSYTLATGSGSTVGARGLTVSFPAPVWGPGVTGAILFASTAEAAGNRLIKITDNGPDSAAQVLLTVSGSQVLSGVRFGPAAAAASIAGDPQNQVVPPGSNAVFTVLTSGRSSPYTYQWYQGSTALGDGPTGSGSAIVGSQRASLLVSNVSVADCANYFVVASNPLNSATSAVAQLDLAIIVTTQPSSVVIAAGETAVFSVAATGHGTLHYQWLFNGNPLTDGGGISGSTTTTLTVNNAQLANVGAYSAAISDEFIATTNSQAAFLQIGTAGTGTGLQGQYWSNQHETPNEPGTFDGPPTLTRVDPTIDFNFGNGSPDPTISANTFAVIWSGQIQPYYSDSYTFTATTDDGVRVWVDNHLIIDQWINHGAAAWSGTISLNANQKYSFVMEYYENTGAALAQLAWSGSIQPNQIIPQSQLYSVGGPTFTVQPTNAVTVQENDTLVLNGGTIVGTGPLSYQWYANGLPLSGQTGGTLVLANVPGSLNNAILTLVAANLYGAATNAGTVLTVQTGAPVITSEIQPSSLTALVGMPTTFAVGVSGTLPNYQWKFNGANLTDSSRITGSHSNVLSIVQALQSDAGTYQLFMTNSFGNNQSAVATMAVTRVALNNGDGWSVQGTNTFPFILNNVLQLTDGSANEASSGFITFPMYIGAFRASWTYQESPGANAADGTCFVLQNSAAGSSARGGQGNGLGYSGINNSAALEFNIFSGGTGGIGIAYGTNGLTGGSTGGPRYSSTAPLNIASGNPINISVQYLGGVISLVMTDAVAGTSFSTNITANIPAAVHTNVAFVGFTSSDGATTSQQQINNFFFTSLPTVSVEDTGANTLRLSWLMAASGGFVLQRSSAVDGTWVNVTDPITYSNGVSSVIVPSSSDKQFYRLVLP